MARSMNGNTIGNSPRHLYSAIFVNVVFLGSERRARHGRGTGYHNAQARCGRMMTSPLKLLKFTAIDGRRIEEQSSNYLALITYFMMGHLVTITRQFKIAVSR